MFKSNWIDKLQIEFIEEPDGSVTINIEWDEEDLDLATWTSLGEEKQKQFILYALEIAVSTALDEPQNFSSNDT